MNFFEHQAAARRNSRVMVVLFLLAVMAVVLAVDVVVGVVWMWTHDARVPPPGVYIVGAAATAALILVVSGVNVLRLADGGAAVARMIGARPVAPGATDPLERRLRNVVEEMAIASGVRVPDVYVMDEEAGINAFAAGWSTSGAAVAVTRGMLETLTRDELQAVVAHEFSHILNGDMRLNVRMLGVLAGIVFIGSIGQFVMRSTHSARDWRGKVAILLAGLAILVIGYAGLFFARLIKSAVSRQREFLADASSVQFTRNPDGIAGALDQIRASSAGTLIANRYAEEMSHMFFGQSVEVWLGGLFATHPPVEERIRRVQPRFEPARYRARRESVLPQLEGRRGGDVAARWGRTPAESAALVGTLDAEGIDYAARILNTLPLELRAALRDAEGARAAMLALLLAQPEPARNAQLAAIQAKALAQRALGLTAHTSRLGAALRLPVVDLALAAVKKTIPEARSELLGALESAVNADRRVSLHEFVVLTLVRDQLAPPAPIAQNRKLSELETEAATLLALVAHSGARGDGQAARQDALAAALRAGAAEMQVGPVAPELTLETVRNALEALRRLAPGEKERLVKGLFAAVTHDGTIRVAEAELMRAVGAVLDCPLPPLFDALDPATLAL
jgi:Zn-dependent protease with chaperone function